MDANQGKRIIALKMRAGYLEAAEFVAKKGLKLPSHVLVDRYFAANDFDTVKDLWVRELVAHPEKGGKFSKGKDVVDSQTGWILPARYVPKDAVGRKGVGLFVDPNAFERLKDKVVVHTESVKIIYPFFQGDGAGRVDEETVIPRAGTWDSCRNSSEERYFHRPRGVSVRPSVRLGIFDGCGGKTVNCDYLPDRAFRVSAEVSADGSDLKGFEAMVNDFHNALRVLRSGFASFTPDEVKALLADAMHHLQTRAAGRINRTTREALTAILNALPPAPAEKEELRSDCGMGITW